MKKKSANVRLSLKKLQERFYDQLPEDEQVAVEVLQAIDDVYVSEKCRIWRRLELRNISIKTLLQTEYSVNDFIDLIFIFFYQMLISFKRN